MGLVNDLLRRGVQEAEVRLGLSVVDRGELTQLRERAHNFEAFAEEASELAYHSLSYFTGRPSELTTESRNRLSQRSRIALMEDPLAQAEGRLLANFSLGRGITIPQAEHPKVQEVIEDHWTDPINVQKLYGFEAQRHRSLELIAQANLYPTAYVRNGYVRLGFLDADTVTHIVCDPEDEERPLWYATRKRRTEYDFENDRMKTIDEMRTETGKPKVVYFPHWRNVEDMIVEAEEDGEKPPMPPEGKRGKGLVEHVRINRIARSQFGTPPWAATLRFFKGLADVTESHVTMAQAASTWIAKRVMHGTPEGITKSANAILTQTGELGAARFGQTHRGEDFPKQPAPPPASFWLENESNKLEALNLNSGAAQAAQTAQIVRAPIAAASSFGQHYLGDASNANLATATSLELPTLMAVQAWQETQKGMLSWSTDLAIQEAVRAGRLGGYEKALTEEEAEEAGVPAHVAAKPLAELHIQESEEKREMERRTGLPLGYTLSMPYPGRRNLPDVVGAVTSVVTAYDPQGVNVPLRRRMLEQLAVHGLQLDDPQGFVDEVMPLTMPEDADGDVKLGPAHLMPGIDPDTGEPYTDQRSDSYVPPEEKGPGSGGGSSRSGKSGGGDKRKDRPKRARTGRTPPSDEMGEELERLGAEVGGLFSQEVIDPLLTGSGRNGDG